MTVTDAPARFSKFDIERVRDRTNLVELIGREVALVEKGARMMGLCPFHFEKTGSFMVEPHRFKCFGCGESGDCFAWMMKREEMSFVEAVRDLGADAGLWSRGVEVKRPERPPIVPREAPEERARTLAAKEERARGMWLAAERDLAGTPVETYWRARGLGDAISWRTRGLGDAISRNIRYLPDHEYHIGDKDAPRGYRNLGSFPVMLAPISVDGGRLVTVHRTYLCTDGSGKAAIIDPKTGEICGVKKLVGAPGHGAIRLTEARRRMVLGEGIETTWAAHLHCPGAGAWAGYSLPHMAGRGIGRGERHPLHPARFLPSIIPDMDKPYLILPPSITEVILLRDADSKDQAAVDAHLQRAAQRLLRENRRVWIASPPDDLDMAAWNLADPAVMSAYFAELLESMGVGIAA